MTVPTVNACTFSFGSNIYRFVQAALTFTPQTTTHLAMRSSFRPV